MEDRRSLYRGLTLQELCGELSRLEAQIGMPHAIFLFSFDYVTERLAYRSFHVDTFLGSPPDEGRSLLTKEAALSHVYEEDRARLFHFQAIVLDLLETLPQSVRETVQTSYHLRWLMAKTGEVVWLSTIARPYTMTLDGKLHFDLHVASVLSSPPAHRGLEWSIRYVDVHGQHIEEKRTFAFLEAGLTAREEEVLNGLLMGSTVDQIAETLCLSLHTVNTHKRNIFKKTGVTSVSGLLKVIYETKT
ncbi:LuxR family transcriptional regulator [Nitritalea halalkaliphila LW7]|uniref:LuxR family transcriptional regulator n=1 Tax=Nitritalea halalkaliphila LW7 TaxID=1189621 RepID=I5C168_9BACT|nr:helix-turn-helix transcriptional regulator [Nitritalea halalkaliphila]EIM75570.1 LuxR family transcriptional regulator [Nitritalea halalkaliphila LW7]